MCTLQMESHYIDEAIDLNSEYCIMDEIQSTHSVDDTYNFQVVDDVETKQLKKWAPR